LGLIRDSVKSGTESCCRVDIAGSAGHPVDHVCLELSKAEYDALDRRLQAEGVDTSARLKRTYGARGWGATGVLLRRSGRQRGRGPLLRVTDIGHRAASSPGCGNCRSLSRRDGGGPLRSPRQVLAATRCARLGRAGDRRDNYGGDPLRPARPGWRSPLAVTWTFPAAYYIGEGPGQYGR